MAPARTDTQRTAPCASPRTSRDIYVQAGQKCELPLPEMCPDANLQCCSCYLGMPQNGALYGVNIARSRRCFKYLCGVALSQTCSAGCGAYVKIFIPFGVSDGWPACALVQRSDACSALRRARSIAIAICDDLGELPALPQRRSLAAARVI